MRAFNYERLKSIANSTSPYRGNKNRFPLFTRRENTKYFLVGKQDGELIFNIVYGSRYDTKHLTKAEFEMYQAAGRGGVHQRGVDEYIMYVAVPHVVGIVRSDNTFEFTNRHYTQGDNKFLSQGAAGYVYNDSRRGGLIYSERNSSRDTPYMLPVYKGMRVDCETMKPLQEFEVIGRNVDRKLSKAMMANYKQFFTVSETMCKVMDMDAFIETANSVYAEYGNATIAGHVDEAMFSRLADNLMHEKPLDAMYLHMFAMNAGRLHSHVRSNSAWGRPSSIEETYATMKRKLVRRLYEENKSIFKEVVYKSGEHLPSSDWGYELRVNGVEVNQC